MTADPTAIAHRATRAAQPYEVRLARDMRDVMAAQRLRYEVFVTELGGDGPMVDHAARLERDEFDPVVDHLLLIDRSLDPAQGQHVVGAYRLLTSDRAAGFGRFYSDAEYDLSPLRASGRRLVELGRSCVAEGHRGGTGMFLLWNGLSAYVLAHSIEVLFGVASFHGTDSTVLAAPLSWLHHHHIAPPELRAVARPEGFQRMDLIPPDQLSRRDAMTAMPALIKAYLRLGGVVGEGAYIDRAFNTTDVFLLMDTAAMSDKHRQFYESRWQPQ